MSLFVIGSVSRVTSNLINHLSKHGIYTSITIADPLPHYNFHHRFYRLQKELDESSSKLSVSITKLNAMEDLKKSDRFDDVLYITHDYYLNVVSKTKLMELTATVCKKRKNLYFVTPAQYDHYGFVNPEGNYQQTQKKVLEINPNSVILRSQIQDNTQTLQILKGLNNIKFIPNTISGNDFASTICDTLSSKAQGKKYIVRPGKTQKAKDQSISYSAFEPIELNHAKENVIELSQKYSKYNFEGYEHVANKQKAQEKAN